MGDSSYEGWVVSSENDLGRGRVVQVDGEYATVSYFVSPAGPQRVRRRVHTSSLEPTNPLTQTRVFVTLPGQKPRAGRVLASEIIPPQAVGKEGTMPLMRIRFPNQVDAHIPLPLIDVRWDRPVEDPTDYLAARVSESPYWHEARAKFSRALAQQRHIYRGMSALASASIELFEHQVETVAAVLTDPVQRYLLADEVGLGKTIEAGVIIRQHLLDEPQHTALVVVPEQLQAQWSSELRDRLNIRGVLAGRVQVVNFADLARIRDDFETTLLVVDEAHQVSGAAHDASASLHAGYLTLRRLAESARSVLLLSATPVLRNEDGFLAMLHLLDPLAYDLEAREEFRTRVARRQDVAQIIRDLEDDAPDIFLEDALAGIAQLELADDHLQRLVQAVTDLVHGDEADPQRQQAIRQLRVHLQETHKLHRRILRTRRAENRIAPDLANREVRTADFRSPARTLCGELIELWRANTLAEVEAPLTDEAHATLLHMLDALLSHPSAVLNAFNVRLAEAGAAPFFAGEEAWLRRAVADLEDAEDSWLRKLGEFIETSDHRWVLFHSSPAIADSVASELRERSVDAARFDPSLVAGQQLGAQVLVCDYRAEEGLNLHNTNAQLLHLDLPLDPNRLEQRIGRLDRLGRRAPIISYIPEPSCLLEEAWYSCLRNGIEVFDRSIAPLQYVLDEAVSMIRQNLLEDGPEILQRLTTEFVAEDGALSLSAELRRIQLNEALSSGGNGPLSTEYFEQLEEYEYTIASDPFREALEAWALTNLQFETWVEDDAVSYGMSRSTRRPTQLPPDAFYSLFEDTGGRGSTRHGRSRFGTPGGMYDRFDAAEASCPIYRVGDPFVDQLEIQMERDDRGMAYAMWRFIDGYQPAHVADIFFQFEFLVVPSLDQQFEGLATVPPAVLRRRSDLFFPPLFETVWVDADLGVVTDSSLLEALAKPYKKPQDSNLSQPKRWAKFDELELVGDWPNLCQQARDRATSAVAERLGLDEIARTAAASIRVASEAIETQLSARLSILQDASRRADEETLQMERRLAAALEAAVKTPSIRVTSAGVKVLSNQVLS